MDGNAIRVPVTGKYSFADILNADPVAWGSGQCYLPVKSVKNFRRHAAAIIPNRYFKASVLLAKENSDDSLTGFIAETVDNTILDKGLQQ